jgi:hypothetical protein
MMPTSNRSTARAILVAVVVMTPLAWLSIRWLADSMPDDEPDTPFPQPERLPTHLWYDSFPYPSHFGDISALYCFYQGDPWTHGDSDVWVFECESAEDRLQALSDAEGVRWLRWAAYDQSDTARATIESMTSRCEDLRAMFQHENAELFRLELHARRNDVGWLLGQPDGRAMITLRIHHP